MIFQEPGGRNLPSLPCQQGTTLKASLLQPSGIEATPGGSSPFIASSLGAPGSPCQFRRRSWSTDPVVRCHGARRERICMYLLGMQRKSSSRKICVVNGSWNVFSMAVTTPRRERHRRMPAHIFSPEIPAMIHHAREHF